MRTRTRAALVSAAAAGLFVTVGSGTAHALPGPGWHSYENYLTGRCLSADTGSPAAYASECTPEGYDSGVQRWYQATNPDGSVTLVNGYLAQIGAENRCLGTDIDHGLMTDCSDSPFHHWWVRPYKNGFILINVGNEHCVDDSFEYNVRSIQCNNTDWQGWW